MAESKPISFEKYVPADQAANETAARTLPNPEKTNEIRDWYAQGFSINAISLAYGYHQDTIRSILLSNQTA